MYYYILKEDKNWGKKILWVDGLNCCDGVIYVNWLCVYVIIF